MKVIFAALLLVGVAAYADCVGTSSQYNQYCTQITDQTTCSELQGFCTWTDGSTNNGTCSGQNALCSEVTDASECTMVGCTWNQ